jgi:septum formation protein
MADVLKIPIRVIGVHMIKRMIILASSSPRRKHLLETIGLSFQVESSGINENTYNHLEPHEQVIVLSAKKAQAVAEKHRNAIIIAADTLGILDGQILGKPDNEYQAIQMLGSMSGKCHTVVTGFTIIDTATNKKISQTVETKVYFRDLTPLEIRAYVRSGEPMDKAGAYAIQGLGSILVEKIEGDYFNVIGLPVCALSLVLKQFGISVLEESNG